MQVGILRYGSEQFSQGSWMVVRVVKLGGSLNRVRCLSLWVLE